nr:DUF6719 family protein [Bradyrhizobium aeschynomenes]
MRLVHMSRRCRAAQSLAGLGLVLLLATPAQAQYVGREQDVIDLRLGQRVLVDDGTCPAGQVKEVSGSRMAETGIVRTTKCVPRFGPKKK